MAARFQAKLVSCDMPEDRFELITRIVEAKFSDLGDTPALVLSILEAIEARISKGYHCIIGSNLGACYRPPDGSLRNDADRRPGPPDLQILNMLKPMLLEIELVIFQSMSLNFSAPRCTHCFFKCLSMRLRVSLSALLHKSCAMP